MRVYCLLYFYLGCTQLGSLCKDYMPELLREALPSEWEGKDMVQWYPDDKRYHHPTKNWLKHVWDYLREQFEKDLCKLKNLPLIPLDLSRHPIELTKMTTPSKIVESKLSENNDILDTSLCHVLKALGVIIMKNCPHFLKSHPGIDKFVHPPSVKGILQALLSSSSVMGEGLHSAILSDVGDNHRRSLRKLIAKVPSSLSFKEKEYLSCLPLFETLSQDFVSKKQGLGALPKEALPFTPRGDFIDVKEPDSLALARLLDIQIPTLTEFLCERIIPDVKGESYVEHEIDNVMMFVIGHIDTDARLVEKMKTLKFVSTNSEGRVSAMELFDPRKGKLREIFAGEDVFPVSQYTAPEVLRHLEKLGMKSEEDITAYDLYKSATKVADIVTQAEAERKSKAILSYLCRHPKKLKENVSGVSLGIKLQDVPWISPVLVKPPNFPSSLPFYGENETKAYFFKPTEVETKDKASLIGAIRPVVPVDSSSEVAKHLGWDKSPRALDVVEHFKILIDCYRKDEKPQYMLMVGEIYSFLLRTDETHVEQALEGIKSSRWIWNGDGFSFPNAVLAGKPSIDLSPYIASLPTEMNAYSELFCKFGMQEQCDVLCLLSVLKLIKQKYEDCEEQQFDPKDVERDLQLSINILNKVQSEGGGELSSELLQQVLLPTFVENDTYVKLAQGEKCVYSKKGSRPLCDDENTDYLLLHQNVPYSTAEFFKVRTLQNSLLDPDELGIGEECGQEEKLTSRLRTLLEDYTDGFAIPKELIQNADDAGATEVRFLYDERTNEDAMDLLFDEGMKECQGPALWVYNDALFEDKDFENLTKLNGATKEEDTEKIGKFGLGFNAVYNLTDVPMLVSRNYFVIFDPNTFHLGKAIRNKNKPGIRLNTNKNAKKLKNFPHQFKPFNGIFGCDLSLKNEDNSFHGTLFRFPLRTENQAIKSEVKKLVYDGKQVKELLQLFMKGAGSLLLFTQNVRRVSVSHLSKEATDAAQPTLMFEVTKSLRQGGIIRKLSMQVDLPPTASNLGREDKRCLEQCNFLKAATKFVEEAETPSAILGRSGIILDIQNNMTEDGRPFFQDTSTLPSGVETWLVASSMGKGEALKFSRGKKGLIPSAGVAVRLSLDNGSVSGSLCPSDFKGTLFCYLPLPIYSGLPLHVNGAFAVASNRRTLKEKTNDDKACVGADWNNILFQDSVCAAYLDLLEDVKSFSTQMSGSKYQFHSLWPTSCKVEKACEPLARSLYYHLACSSSSLFSDGEKWVSIHDVVFLDPQFRKDSEVGDISFEVFQMLVSKDIAVIDLPFDVYKSFENYGYEEVICSKRYDENRFFSDLFFPNIGSVPRQFRDRLLMYALDKMNEGLDELIKSHACIPATPHGQILKCPNQLISPNGDAALLFSPLDERFPQGSEQTFLHPSRLFKLQQLGMATDNLSWSEIAERAESISILNQSSTDAANERAENLIAFLEKKLSRDGNPPPMPEDYSRILKAKFLPVLKKPQSFPLTWKGSDTKSGKNQVFVSAIEGFLPEHMYLLCCSEPIIGGYISENAKTFLDLKGKRPTIEHVLEQITKAICTESELNDAEYEEIRNTCTQCYKFLQEALGSSKTRIASFSQDTDFILVGNKFLPAKKVAFNLPVDCSPYLYKVPEDLAWRYPMLMKVAGVRETFQVDDFMNALRQIKENFQDEVLDKETLQIAINLAIQLEKSLGEDHQPVAPEFLYLPDAFGVMQRVSELCINDCPWILGNTDVQYVNPGIPTLKCYRLGVKTRRAEALRHHAYGISFGQREKLENRLKRILDAYPCGKELLKELLQNADDAQATEICFVVDPRSHSKIRVFEKCWEPLQGPALCVYNNKPFTEADLVGIQNLGEGSKGDDPNKTGQYGVGFNAVYHLTDVPSFISTGEEIGDVLCAFDPNCHYVPGANPQEPGRMYKKTKELRNLFPDVFSCYLEKHFQPFEDSTMFRFPLRTQQMAKDSSLSTKPVTLQELKEMMEALKKELFEVLVFVNNVKKITLCDIDEDSGDILSKYSVEVVMSHEDEQKRHEFVNHLLQTGKSTKQKRSVLLNTEVKKCSYIKTLRDSYGKEEKWFVVQQFGFEKPVPPSIAYAYQNHDLGLIPRGGVACLLEKNSTSVTPLRKKKVFCFLPLPIETNLPVHINGHFALDHEARRNLWWDETSGYRSDWNNALLSDVIASCYLTLLDEVRRFYQLPVTPGELENLSCCEQDLAERFKDFEKLFPKFDGHDSHWNTLVKSVYKKMDEKRCRLLPVVNCWSRNAAHVRQIQVTWLPPTGTGNDQAFFNNIGTDGSPGKDRTPGKHHLAKILIQTGFNLLNLSASICEAFNRSGVRTCYVSPSSVINFFKKYDSQDSHCILRSVPVDVGETPLENAATVSLVLAYCKSQDHFLRDLHGLPLLLTQDNVLRTFDVSNQKFLSRYHDILPNSEEMFVHEKIRSSIFSNPASLEARVFRRFDVNAFVEFLPRSYPVLFNQSDYYLQWDPENPTQPGRPWVTRVWSFLGETLICNQLSSLQASMLSVLTKMYSCKILPATEKPSNIDLSDSFLAKGEYLVPLKLAGTVLDSNEMYKGVPLFSALRDLGLPEMNNTVLCASSAPNSFLGSYYLARHLVASPEKPKSIIASLAQMMTRKPHALQGKLNASGCKIVLRYFSQSVESLKGTLSREELESSKTVLRKLPFYPATHNRLVSLDNQKVCVLPDKIPREEMTSLEEKVDVLFLEHVSDLLNLYEFLAFDCITTVDIYCQFILPNFEIFSKEARMRHLLYLRDSLLKHFLEEKEKERLLRCLMNTAIITTLEGTLRMASFFFDPRNEVFRAMLPEEMFPPEPFNHPEWLPFMKVIGMINEVSGKHFISFAKDVAREAKMHRTLKTVEKSKLLVSSLFKRSKTSDGLLQAVCDIPFVVSDPIPEDIKKLHTPFGAQNDDRNPFISFKDSVLYNHIETVWTTAYLLPKWADPREPSNLTREDSVSTILSHLRVLVEPTLQMVFSHCINIVQQGAVENASNFPEGQVVARTSVMRKIYAFLDQKVTQGIAVHSGLQDIPCILVERGARFVKCKQVVLHGSEDLEITPFLYRLPLEIGDFHRLFLHLGCSKDVRATHYAMVLEMLHDHVRSMKLNPNQITSSLKAVRGFFERLKQHPDEKIECQNLYLPAVYSVNRCSFDNLHKSTDLIFDDAPHYRCRLERYEQPLVVDLKMVELQCPSSMNYKDYILCLPDSLRPQFLSKVVQEKLVTSLESGSLVSHVAVADSLKKQLCSEQFFRGILRLIRHANQDGRTLDESASSRLKSTLRSIEFLGLNGIVTQLECEGDIIPGSEAEVPHFLEKVSEGGRDVWKVYVNAEAENTDTQMSLTLTQVISEACEGLLRENVMFIPELLRTKPHKIWSILDHMSIRQDDSYDPSLSDLLPDPGDFIPIEDHHLLNEGFEDFFPGEYVGFELEDPSLEEKNEEATFIYAIIVEEINSQENASIYTKRYKVNVGHEKQLQVADSTDLYKFHSLQTHSGNQERPTSEASKKELLIRIAKGLKVAWNLPEKKRIKIIKRLFLQWHPEKNLGDAGLYNEVIQHLQNEIGKLDSGETTCNQVSSYKLFYNVWTKRAKLHHTRRQEYRAAFDKKYGSRETSTTHSFKAGIPPSFCKKNPQPGQARRWFRQAEADLKAVKHDLAVETPSYEWACFKSHQVHCSIV